MAYEPIYPYGCKEGCSVNRMIRGNSAPGFGAGPSGQDGLGPNDNV